MKTTAVETRCVACACLIARGKVMCDPHWRLLPDRAKEDVFKAWMKPPNDTKRRQVLAKAGTYVRRKAGLVSIEVRA